MRLEAIAVATLSTLKIMVYLVSYADLFVFSPHHHFTAG